VPNATEQVRCATTLKIENYKDKNKFYIYSFLSPYIKIITVIKVIAVKIVITHFCEGINS
jgi:hypothetical protein